MRPFMDDNFLLFNDTARTLYHEYAAKMPILDYHCHISPEDIDKDRHYENITQLWLLQDHYKWRLMRCAGVPEALITGDAPDELKFYEWAKVLSKAIGNPLYHWSHLELKRFFGYDGILNEKTAKSVWEITKKKLTDPSCGTRSIIKGFGVRLICTTDDPADDLYSHKRIAADPDFDVQVLPSFRPDRAMNIEDENFLEYLDRLSRAEGREITSYGSLKDVMRCRMDLFASLGCVVSDHALSFVMYQPATEEQIGEIFRKRLQDLPLTFYEILAYKTAFLLFAAAEYHRRGWIMQLHYGAQRNNNSKMFRLLGADTGYDCISSRTAGHTAAFLDALSGKDQLPKTVLYSLSPNDNAAISSLAGCFQDDTAITKIQHGCAWWFNDHRQGMEEHLASLASLGYLPGFIGMLTDSRSFLSYTRHEYFRRILCNFMGEMTERGEFPSDMETLSSIVRDISYDNAVRYFGFSITHD